MVPYAEKHYGVPYLYIHRADFHSILVAEAERSGVKLQLGSTVTKIEFDTASIGIRDKPDFHADLIPGADRLKSTCCESLLGHVDPPRLTDDLANRIVIKAEDMQKHPDLRELAEEPVLSYWMGPYGHVVCYLLQGGGLYSIRTSKKWENPSLVGPKVENTTGPCAGDDEMEAWSKCGPGNVLTIYERLRKERTIRVVKGSTALRDLFRQQERDRQLTQQEPFERYPNRWADPAFQEYIFGCDAFAEVDKAWKGYKTGTFPGTAGHFKSNL
ncbi:MAG: hypothetical protein Q9175_002570 [Cornicularia normoerica]